MKEITEDLKIHVTDLPSENVFSAFYTTSNTNRTQQIITLTMIEFEMLQATIFFFYRESRARDTGKESHHSDAKGAKH